MELRDRLSMCLRLFEALNAKATCLPKDLVLPRQELSSLPTTTDLQWILSQDGVQIGHGTLTKTGSSSISVSQEFRNLSDPSVGIVRTWNIELGQDSEPPEYPRGSMP